MKYEIESAGTKRRVDVNGCTPSQLARCERELGRFANVHTHADGTGFLMARPRDVAEIRSILERISCDSAQPSTPVSVENRRRAIDIRCRNCGTTAAFRFTTLPHELRTCDDCA